MENVSASASKLKALEGENHKQAENFIGELQKQLDEKKNELEAVRSELSIEKEKLLSLEHTLSSLQSGEAERVAQEQERAEERAAQQREKDEKHALELREVENTKRRMETKLKTEISTMKMEAEKTEANLISQYDNLRRSKDNEIQELNKDMSERKAKFAQELSSAQMMAEGLV